MAKDGICVTRPGNLAEDRRGNLALLANIDPVVPGGLC